MRVRRRNWGPHGWRGFCGPNGWRGIHRDAIWEEGQGGRPSPNRLYRNLDNAVLKGVCSGIADYFGIEPWFVRIGAILSLFAFTFPTLIGYFILYKMVPPKPAGLYETPSEEAFWTGVRVEPTGTVSGLRHRFREFEKRLRDLETFVTSREFRLNREINDL